MERQTLMHMKIKETYIEPVDGITVNGCPFDQQQFSSAVGLATSN
jgi:hypothetical protein